MEKLMKEIRVFKYGKSVITYDARKLIYNSALEAGFDDPTAAYVVKKVENHANTEILAAPSDSAPKILKKNDKAKIMSAAMIDILNAGYEISAHYCRYDVFSEEFELYHTALFFYRDKLKDETDLEAEPDQKIAALARYLSVDPLTLPRMSDARTHYGDQEYLVLTDKEANDAWDVELSRRFDELVSELPDGMKELVDKVSWTSAAARHGRADVLSTDFTEGQVTHDDTKYFIYKTDY